MELALSELVKKLTEWLEEKKAEKIRVYDVRSKSDYTDMIIVCEGSGELHNRALAENIATHCKQESIYIMGKEGQQEGKWILIDLVSVIIHIFDSETRDYYDLEKIWKESERVRMQNTQAQPKA